MNKRWMLIFFLYAAPLVYAQQNDQSADSEAFRRRIEEFKDAYNNNDTTALASFYTDDAEYVSPHVKNLIIRGRTTVTENFKKGISMGGHIDSVTVLSYGSSCNLAYLVCRYVATNAGTTVNGRNILIMKKIGGAWLIVTHASIIRD